MVYRTIEGDRWDYISYRFYGFPDLYHEIIKANYTLDEFIKASPVLPAGIELVIPDIKPEVEYPQGLPAWKR